MSDELDRPLGAFVLSLIGGVLILAAGAVLAAAGSALGALGFGGGGVIAGLGALGAIFGFLIIILAIGMFVNPDFHVISGVGILILSLLSLIGGAGFFIGLILGVVGGILALVFHPTEDMDDLFPGTTSGGVCRNCGARVPQGPRGYCPSCGHPFG